jgi:hypothetical protein
MTVESCRMCDVYSRSLFKLGECHGMLQNIIFWLQQESFMYDVCAISVFVIWSEQYSDIIMVSYSR